MRKKRDIFTKKAKKEGYRSRAVYKLQALDTKFKIFSKNQIIIDLCGAPGGFSQVARDRTNGCASIFLVDLARVKPFPGITGIIKGDITKFSTIQELQSQVSNFNPEIKEIVVLADCSPDVSGSWEIDHARQIWLTEVALGISNYFCAKKFVTKIFQGELSKSLLDKIKLFFENVSIYKPPTSRKQSAETYIVAVRGKKILKELYQMEFLVKE
ncbi:SAM-dependent methyltransferase [Candidatus Hodarchaeum mangrovi]